MVSYSIAIFQNKKWLTCLLKLEGLLYLTKFVQSKPASYHLSMPYLRCWISFHLFSYDLTCPSKPIKWIRGDNEERAGDGYKSAAADDDAVETAKVA